MRKFSSIIHKIIEQEGVKRPSLVVDTDEKLRLDNEHIKTLIIETQFLNELTQHSNPQLQQKINEDEQLRNNCQAKKSANIFQKDFIINQYEALVQKEKEWIEGLVKGAEFHDDGKDQKTDRNVLPPGSFVNSCKLISPKTYLGNYMITFDANLPENKDAIIATLT